MASGVLAFWQRRPGERRREQLHRLLLGHLTTPSAPRGHLITPGTERQLPTLACLEFQRRVLLRSAEESQDPVILLHLDDGDATTRSGQLVDIADFAHQGARFVRYHRQQVARRRRCHPDELVLLARPGIAPSSAGAHLSMWSEPKTKSVPAGTDADQDVWDFQPGVERQ